MNGAGRGGGISFLLELCKPLILLKLHSSTASCVKSMILYFPLSTLETDLDLFLLQSMSFYWRNHLSDLNE